MNQVDLFVKRVSRIDSVVERLLKIYDRLSSSRNPSFTARDDTMLSIDYREVFPQSGGSYNYHGLELLEFEASEETLFLLTKQLGYKLLTNPADILLSANKLYERMIRAGRLDGADPEITTILAETVEARHCFRDIHGHEYYCSKSGKNAGFSIFYGKKDSRLLVDFLFNDISYQLSRTDGKPVRNPVPDTRIRVMEKLLDELEPWAYRMLALPNKQK